MEAELIAVCNFNKLTKIHNTNSVRNMFYNGKIMSLGYRTGRNRTGRNGTLAAQRNEEIQIYQNGKRFAGLL